MIKLWKRFWHNKIGYGYPVEKLEHDDFQPVYKCECGGRLAQDSTGAWFHLGTEEYIL